MDNWGLTTRDSYSSSLYAIEEFSVIGTSNKQEDYTGCIVDRNASIMVLCDGIGGLERGDLASKTAVNAVLRLATEVAWKDNPAEYLPMFLFEANEAVFRLCDEENIPVNAGTTIVLVLTVGRRLYIANVGDSRAYLIKKEGMIQLTQDHNYGEQLRLELEEGLITQEEYDVGFSRSASLTSYLGIGNLKQYYVTVDPILFDRDEIVLIESDGLYKLLDEDSIYQVVRNHVRSLDEAGEHLLQMAKANVTKYQDNTSIILLRIK